MTISSTIRVAGPFTGNGTASAFPFAWKVFSAADVEVVRRNVSSGVDTTLVLNTDYTVTLNGNQNTNPGGTVTLVAGALASGLTLTVTSDLANLQPTDLTNQGGFYPEVINDSLDRATIQIQQLAGEVSRSIRAPLADGSPAMVLPPSGVRSNGFLAFDGNGLPTIQAAASGAAPTSITRQVFSGTGSQTVFNLSTDPGGAGNSAQVFIGGVYQQRNTYTINGTVLTFSQAPVAGTNNVEFVNFLIGSGANGVGIVTLTGDVTGSGTGTVPAAIAADSVTFAKMQNIATDRLLGRDTAGTGDVEELTVSGGIEFTGTGIRTSAFTGDVTKAAGGVATTIATDAVTTAKILNANVTPAKLSTGAPTWDGSGNVNVGGDLTVTGNDIKSSGGTTALTMSGADVTAAGDIILANTKGIDFSATANGAGTPTSEKLTDFEEGTWVPVYEAATGSFTTLTMNVVSARYTKIGNMVIASAHITTDDVSIGTASGNLFVAGFPYAQANIQAGGGAVTFAGGWNVDHPAGLIGSGPTTRMFLTYRNTAGNSITSLVQASDLLTGAGVNRNIIVFTATYWTA